MSIAYEWFLQLILNSCSMGATNANTATILRLAHHHPNSKTGLDRNIYFSSQSAYSTRVPLLVKSIIIHLYAFSNTCDPATLSIRRQVLDEPVLIIILS